MTARPTWGRSAAWALGALVLATSLLVPSTAQPARAEVIERVVAVVND